MCSQPSFRQKIKSCMMAKFLKSDNTNNILTLLKIEVMIYMLELENNDDFPKVKKLLEQIKGAKIFDTSESESYPDGTPKWFIDELADYADRLTEKDMITEEEFSDFVKDERCKLNLPNQQR